MSKWKASTPFFEFEFGPPRLPFKINLARTNADTLAHNIQLLYPILYDTYYYVVVSYYFTHPTNHGILPHSFDFSCDQATVDSFVFILVALDNNNVVSFRSKINLRITCHFLYGQFRL